MFGITWLDPQTIIESMGGFAVLVILAMVFMETGLLVGFFLPGDSLLFITGLMVGSGAIVIGSYQMPIWLMCALISITAFIGDQTGYFIGRKAGHALFNRPESKLFSHKNVDRTHAFFERYGARAVILAHFVPVMRTFVPVAAGIGEMSYPKFVRYNVIGVLAWGTGVTLMGFFLGSIPLVRDHVEWFTIGFVVLSTIPIALEVLKARREDKALTNEQALKDAGQQIVSND
jgi:membrane-associated protein